MAHHHIRSEGKGERERHTQELTGYAVKHTHLQCAQQTTDHLIHAYTNILYIHRHTHKHRKHMLTVHT